MKKFPGKRLVVLAEREGSGMTSAWNEYLCLQRTKAKLWTLFTGRYQVIGEKDAYYNEETEEYDIPEKIKGKVVVGVEDEYVVGGDIDWYDDGEAFDFIEPDENLDNWLEQSEWSDFITLDAVTDEWKTLQRKSDVKRKIGAGRKDKDKRKAAAKKKPESKGKAGKAPARGGRRGK